MPITSESSNLPKSQRRYLTKYAECKRCIHKEGRKNKPNHEKVGKRAEKARPIRENQKQHPVQCVSV